MKYILSRDKGKCKIEFTLSFEEWAVAMENAYKNNRHRYNIQGFRKGHAPRGIIEKHYGATVFAEEAISDSFSQHYATVLQENVDITPVEVPALQLVSLDNNVVFVAEFWVRPEVKLGKYKGLLVERISDKVEESDVDKEIDSIRAKHARKIEADRAVEKGDIVTFDFSGSVDGVKFDGGTASGFELEIGSGQFIPGFEDQLVGLKKGESKDVEVRFPENYHAGDIAGKDAVFACHVHKIEYNQQPKLDDEFVKDISVFDSVGEYRQDTKERLQKEATVKAESAMDNSLLEAIVKQVEVDVPIVLVDRQIDSMVYELERMLQRRGIKLDEYLKMTNTNIVDVKEQYRKEAEWAVKVRLSVEEIIRIEGIDASESEIEAELDKLAKDNNTTIDEVNLAIKDKRLSLEEVIHSVRVSKMKRFLRDNNTLGQTNASDDTTGKSTGDNTKDRNTAKDKSATKGIDKNSDKKSNSRAKKGNDVSTVDKSTTDTVASSTDDSADTQRSASKANVLGSDAKTSSKINKSSKGKANKVDKELENEQTAQ